MLDFTIFILSLLTSTNMADDAPLDKKAKVLDLLKVELKRKLDMESERLRRANRNLEDDDSKEYIIGKITGQSVELMDIMTTISDMERANDEN